MGLICVPVPGKEKSRLICRAFEAGAPRSAEGYVFFGTEGVQSQFNKARAGKKPWWYIDNSYVDKHRGIYFRVTKNGLQVNPFASSLTGIYDNRRTGLREWWSEGRFEGSRRILSGTCESDFGAYPDRPPLKMKASDGARWAKLDAPIKPWRTDLGNDILVVPQSDLFMKSTGASLTWAVDTVKTLKSYGLPFPIRVRLWSSDKFKQAAKLVDDLPNLRLLVTWSSASALTAMFEGVPAISMSPDSAAHWLTGPLTCEAVGNPPRPDGRVELAHVLADNQFTLEEFRNGTAWRMLEKNT